ncbi:hypothetical protein L3Q82_026077 [Scortum barcoo]|uniref:Uncharacterized protein n=1 Tax=Scortum barcoo TaxID=214431 RepID=A0ACB8WP97_9TELE|nr:hypothetical protein L3Q82_026077 [Scortum barcoo]
MMKLILSLTLIWALSSTGTSSGNTAQYISKGCASSSECPVTGTQTISYSYFDMRQVTSTKCCSTDNCNSETLPFPPAPTTNSLQCFTCNFNGSECNTKLQCRGVEDRCFKVNMPIYIADLLLPYEQEHSSDPQYIKSSSTEQVQYHHPGKLTCSTQDTYLFIMMKLILSLTLIWALSSTAGALQCQICSNFNFNCSSTESSTCPSDTMCATFASLVTSSGNTAQYISKGCALSSACPVTGTQTISFSFFDMRQVTSTKCCSTDNCNSETLPFPAPTTNSLQCFTCNSKGSECNTKLQCRGVEDRCFKLDGESL